MTPSCSVLVIGGSGFLGQHVISLLQTRSPWVTEIRCLDVIQYEKKLDHSDRVPVRVFTGSVINEALVSEACGGVNIVIHVAAIIDISMFPDVERTTQVNVEGVSTVLRIARESTSVRGYIFSSSVSVHMGQGISGMTLTERSPIPERRYYEPYATSKLQAERLVIDANDEDLSTLVIRPSVMYGELDNAFCRMQLELAVKMRGRLIGIKASQAVHQPAYVANVAWGFVCAAEKLNNLTTGSRTNKTSSETSGEDTGNLTNTNDVISGDIFIIADDSEPIHIFNRHVFFMEAIGIKYLFKVPLSIIHFSFVLLYFILNLLTYVGVNINFSISPVSLEFFKYNYVYSDEKARRMLGYAPLYSPQEADDRSLRYYKRQWIELTKVK